MKKIKKLDSVTRLFIAYGLIGVAASLAHPITPNLMAQLNMPNYMFGVALAAMGFTNFLMSPFWGNLNNYVSSRKILAFCMVGYSLGQAIFGFGSTKTTIVAGRMIAGLFTSGMNVTAPYYALKHSSDDLKGSNVTKTITLFTVTGTLGYLIGGVIGNANIYYAIALQCIMLLICGLICYMILDDQEVSKNESYLQVIKESNPIQSFFHIKEYLNLKIFLLFACVLMASLASTSLTQNFQYYLQDHLQMNSAVGGLTRSLVGVFAVLTNFMITTKILKSKKVERHISLVFTIMIATIGFLKLVSNNALLFSIVGISLLVMDTVQISLLQGRNAELSTKESQGVMVGMHNSMKALGMIGGSLMSGFIYDFNPFYPFIFSLVFYLLALTFNTVNLRKEVNYERSTKITQS